MTDNEMDELTHRVEGAHRAVPGAYDPAADVWQRAKSLANLQQTREETNVNIAPILTAPSTPSPVFVGAPRTGLSRYTNIAATLAIVAILAFGGWFAAVNLQPGDNGNHLAMSPATPLASESCDVEPITVDQFMGLVENPHNYLSEHVQPGLLDSPDRPGFTEALLSPNSHEFAIAPRTTPAERDFQQAREAADIFLSCMAHGTYGQIWVLVDPVNLQEAVFTEFPVYRSKSDIQEYVQSLIDVRPGLDVDSSGSVAQFAELATNSGLEDAEAVWPEVGIGHVMPIIEIGLIGPSLDEKVVFDIGFDAPMATYWATPAMPGPTIVMGQSTVDLRWYVLPWLQN